MKLNKKKIGRECSHKTFIKKNHWNISMYAFAAVTKAQPQKKKREMILICVAEVYCTFSYILCISNVNHIAYRIIFISSFLFAVLYGGITHPPQHKRKYSIYQTECYVSECVCGCVCAQVPIDQMGYVIPISTLRSNIHKQMNIYWNIVVFISSSSHFSLI